MRLEAPLWLEFKLAESLAQVRLLAFSSALWLLGFPSRNLVVPVPLRGHASHEGCLLKIYVGNLNPTTDDALLRQTFTSHGEVSTASIVRDRETQTSRGFGFIEMPGAPEAQAAIAALNGSTLDGKLLVVNEARARETGPREVRSGSSSR
jgi:RNA recognition motif. (a.k.a. RRM, RBD, or RNP domain)